MEEMPMPDTIKIQMILDKVQVFLARWLDCHLKRVYKTDFWQSAVLNALTKDQCSNVEEEGASTLEDLDFATLVAVFLGNFRVLRREVHLDSELSDMAKHVKKIRNLYAHKNSKTITKPNLKKVKYHCETLYHFLEGLGADVTLLKEVDTLYEAITEGGIQLCSVSRQTIVTSDGIKIKVSSSDTPQDISSAIKKENPIKLDSKADAIKQINVKPIEKTPVCMQLPEWIDNLIYGELGAIYCRSCCDMTVVDWNHTEIKKYLGTYFPRSYVESFCLYSDYFKVHFEEYKSRRILSVFDFGSGTGGEIFGFLDAVERILPDVDSVKVRALDGNHCALRVLERIVEYRNTISKLVVNLKTMPVTIDDFYDLGVARSVVDDTFDFFMTFKAVCEFVTKQQFEENNPYANIIQLFSDILVPDGKMLITDVSTKNGTSQEWLPTMLDIGIKESGAVILDRNDGFNETFVVKHSRFAFDQSKIAWRFVEPIKGGIV